MCLLQKTYKKAIRLLEIGKIHVEPILKRKGLLSINDEYKLSLIKLAWECTSGVSKLTEHITERQGRLGLHTTRRYYNIRRRYKNADNNIIYNLEKTLNIYHTRLAGTQNIKLLLKTIKRECINNYTQRVRCYNVGCVECH